MAEPRGRLLFLPAVIVTQVLYAASVWFVGPVLRERATEVSFLAAVTVTYAVLFLTTYLIMRLVYWERVSHLDDGSGLRVFGISLSALLRRTGCQRVDWGGLVLSAALVVACAVFPRLQVLVPFAGLCLLAFLGPLLAGRSGPWEVRRRTRP